MSNTVSILSEVDEGKAGAAKRDQENGRTDEGTENEQAGGDSDEWSSWTWETELQYVDRTKVEIGDKVTYHWIPRNHDADCSAEIILRNANNITVGHWNTEWMEPFSGMENGILKMEGTIMKFLGSASPGGTTLTRTKITFSSNYPGEKENLMALVENPDWVARGDESHWPRGGSWSPKASEESAPALQL